MAVSLACSIRRKEHWVCFLIADRRSLLAQYNTNPLIPCTRGQFLPGNRHPNPREIIYSRLRIMK